MELTAQPRYGVCLGYRRPSCQALNACLATLDREILNLGVSVGMFFRSIVLQVRDDDADLCGIGPAIGDEKFISQKILTSFAAGAQSKYGAALVPSVRL